MVDTGRTYSARAAAEVVDVDARTIRRAIAAGDLQAERTASGFVIGGGDLATWAQRRSASTTSTSACVDDAVDDRRVAELQQRVVVLEAVVAEERRRAQDERDRAARAEQAAGLWQGRAEILEQRIAQLGASTTAEQAPSTSSSATTRPAGLWQRLRGAKG